MPKPYKVLEAIVGESVGTWSFTLDAYNDLSSADWTGRIVVKKAIQHEETKQWMPSGAAIINKTIAKDILFTKFLTDLLPEDTDKLDPFKTYVVTSVLINNSISLKREMQKYIYMLPKGDV